MSEIASREIVIIGGGAVGAGVAYGLAEAGKTDILVVEKESAMAAATTSQAAGLVGQVRDSVDRVKLAMWSVETFSKLQQCEEFNPSWRQVGSLRVALCDQRAEEFERMRSVCAESGLEVEFISKDEAREMWPAMSFDEAKAVLWCPTDGYLQPSDLTLAYVHHCRRMGVTFMTSTAVTAVLTSNGRVIGVETNRGTIRCETVINAGGAHAYHIAKSAGLDLPIVPVRHEFFVTVPTNDIGPTFPVMRIPDIGLYLRGEVNSLLVGGWEPRGLSVDPRSFSLERNPPYIEDDWDVLGEFGEMLYRHMPKVFELGVRSVFKGWPTFTPDGRFIIGESSRVRGFVMAGGCNAHGVSGSAGIGRHVVESMLEDDPSPYVRSLSPDRFGEMGWSWDEARRKAQRHYETYYSL